MIPFLRRKKNPFSQEYYFSGLDCLFNLQQCQVFSKVPIWQAALKESNKIEKSILLE